MKINQISFFTAVFFLLVFAVQSNAQVTLQLGAGLGYSTPTGDYGGDMTEFYNGTKYGIESGFNYHAKARVGLLFLNIFGEIGYTTFTGEGEATPGQGNINLSNNVFSMKVGPEFPITIPLSPITPYLMGFVAVNTFSGEVEFENVNGINGTYDLASATRVGIGGGGGVTLSAGPLKLDLSIQYHLINFTGKEYKIENVTLNNRLDNYTSLNDAADPAYVSGSDNAHFIQDDRGIGAMEFKLTAMFGL